MTPQHCRVILEGSPWLTAEGKGQTLGRPLPLPISLNDGLQSRLLNTQTSDPSLEVGAVGLTLDYCGSFWGLGPFTIQNETRGQLPFYLLLFSVNTGSQHPSVLRLVAAIFHILFKLFQRSHLLSEH